MRMIWMWCFAAVFAVGFAAGAHALTFKDRTLVWDCPTTRVPVPPATTGEPFDCATDAAGYNLEATAPGGSAVITDELPSATSRVITSAPAGTAYRIRVCDNAGECSAWSNTAKKPGKPATPGGWKVQ